MPKKRSKFKHSRILEYLINPSFQGVKRRFVLTFENEAGRVGLAEYYLPTIEVKDYNVKIKGWNFFIKK